MIGNMSETVHQVPFVLAITACPTGIAHTYMAAERLSEAALAEGIELKIETHGSIGVEGTFSEQDIKRADAILIAADTTIDTARFSQKPLINVSVAQAIHEPNSLLHRVLDTAKTQDKPSFSAAHDAPSLSALPQQGLSTGARSSVGRTVYAALMNGVSHMIPFVVTGGLLLAIALSIGGEPTAEGLKIPEGSFWDTVQQLGVLAFSLMVPVLSAYIAQAIADRPGLAPGFITGLVATTGSLYNSEAGAGFIGGIATGFLSGYVALGIRKIPVHKYVAPIWPIIVIPILTTAIVGLLFIYVLGHPIAALFEALTGYLASMQGESVVILGALLGAMIAFDMGGPFNKTAFLFSGGLIAAGNALPMGMIATAIAVPPLGVGLATLVRRSLFSKPERDAGIAAVFMGFFGITEGAIPLAAARPLQIIPANVIGGAAAAALAGSLGVKDHVMHGGPIVAVFGAVDNVSGYFLALAVGVIITCVLSLIFAGFSGRKANMASPSSAQSLVSADAQEAAASETEVAVAKTWEPIITDELVYSGSINDREEAICCLVNKGADAGRISDTRVVVEASMNRDRLGSTNVGYGVAIPHSRSAGTKTAMVGLARLDTPIEWTDGEETDLVFLICVPANAGKQHLKILSRLARAIMKEDFREQLRQAPETELADLVRRVAEPAEFTAAGAS
ncbi:fructose-specific PTS transporter subunit EIIC [Corynebacterium pseudotuberculosis]|uniref:fructose-specific PTS transporter subunit EIIC n=1 Tax=Corynebacterium pseudotuberculosis TaxID=1719 RepID=UPI0001DD8414|nr:fructose-specific PTS transporter subunit EIIC [Corynebacterium pseudotuberculosis]ADK29117.1 PTS mannose transporter subunit IIABC [Corynebacterium pseudotuberculosis FRC41]ALU19755.1 PTS mannose transporter subunit IIABC [Corynebacterium pseudotuberculosis]